MKIYAPVKDTNGIYASVLFKNGVGETDEPYLIEWFKRNGYRVEDEVKFNAQLWKFVTMSLLKKLVQKMHKLNQTSME